MHKKLIAPTIVTVLNGLWLAGWALVCLLVPEVPFGIKFIGAIIPLSLLGVMIFVLLERIQEVRSGEEDDLSNY